MADRTAARLDRARQLGDEGGARGGDGDARLGHGALEAYKTRGIADLLRQQTIALLHGALELAEASTVARIETSNQTIEKTPAFGRRSGEEAIQGGGEPKHLDVLVEGGRRPRLTGNTDDPSRAGNLGPFSSKSGA